MWMWRDVLLLPLHCRVLLNSLLLPVCRRALLD
jgi:hypothetical protein